MAKTPAKRKAHTHAGAAPAASSSQPAKPEATPSAAGGARLRVRMYRQGLGDCFLLSLLRPAGCPFHMLIDCGVILGTPDAAARLETVVRDVVRATGEPGRNSEEAGGYADVLVVTHEHYDHVAGFKLAKGLFAAPDERNAPGKLSVGKVWFAWTEDPSNQLAQQLRDERKAHLRALTAMASYLRASGADEDTAPGVLGALQFFGVGRDGSGLGDTAQAMANAAGFVPEGQVAYLKPGTILSPEGAPELRVYALGPPMDRASLKRTDSSTEVYHFDADNLVEAVRLAAAGDASPDGQAQAGPFDPVWAFPLSDLAAGRAQGPVADFLSAHYFGPQTPTPDADVSWRRVDGAWLASSEQLALALDSATNNTSLALAIELADSGKVLLFPADAQVGNWLSWQALSWTLDGKQVTAPDLLKRTVFYKVGHHGSHNATLKDKGLELMPEQGMVAFVPVDHDMAVAKRWGQMPLPALIEALGRRCGTQLVRADAELAEGVQAVSAGGEGVQFSSLYYEWALPL